MTSSQENLTKTQYGLEPQNYWMKGLKKLASAADGEPGEYFLYNGGTGLVVATLQKMAAGPTRIIRYWT